MCIQVRNVRSKASDISRTPLGAATLLIRPHNLLLPIAMNLKGTGGADLILASAKDFSIPLVSSVRIGLASRVLLVQANTGSCVVGEPAWVVRS